MPVSEAKFNFVSTMGFVKCTGSAPLLPPPRGRIVAELLSLENILHPPAPDPRSQQFRQRSEEFQKQLPERLKQLQAGSDPGVVRGFGMVGGAGGFGSGRRQAYGIYSYSWQGSVRT